MKKFIVILASFVLSTGISFANNDGCGDDEEMRPIVVSAVAE